MTAKSVATGLPYKVLIGNGILQEAGLHMAEALGTCKLCVVTDETVHGLYGETLLRSLREVGFDAHELVLPAGEQSKSMGVLETVLNFMASRRLSRSDAAVAFGGGVIGDVTGFAAACYMRGIRYVQMPTTLLAAVDSSIGGKTGVNLAHGKNLAGAFWQPSLVLCDSGLLGSLDREALLDGMAEAIKHGMVADADFLGFMGKVSLQSLFRDNLLDRIIEKCVIIKSGIVCRDERDAGDRRLLNFGHTIGHAVGRCSGYSVSHGRAVALGMLHIARSAARSGMSPASCGHELARILMSHGFELSCGFSADELYEAALSDKKRAGGSIAVVVPSRIGECRVETIDESLFREFVERGF